MTGCLDEIVVRRGGENTSKQGRTSLDCWLAMRGMAGTQVITSDSAFLGSIS